MKTPSPVVLPDAFIAYFIRVPSTVITVSAHRHISLRGSSLKRTDVPALACPENGVYVISSTTGDGKRGRRETHIVSEEGRRRCNHLREREIKRERKRSNFDSFSNFTQHGDPSHRQRNEANQPRWKLSLRRVCVEVALSSRPSYAVDLSRTLQG